ncbi:hypothetical protein F5141DRAFT_1060008 [Pisolithus sp. B1]|nr:hypothetical protein F5141DRAFT_1060008 [Pisolithus sp. B1]
MCTLSAYLRVRVGWRGAASWPWLCYALWQLPFRESVWGYPMSPVSVSDVPEDFRHLVWWQSEDDLVLILVCRLYLCHPGSSCKPSEPFHVHEEVLNQLHENASYLPVSIIHNHPAGCMSCFDGTKRGISGHTKAACAWFVKGVGMSMMLFGDGAGGAVSSDSSTPFVPCRPVSYSHGSFGLLQLVFSIQIESCTMSEALGGFMAIVRFDPAVTASVCEGLRRVYEAIGRRFWWPSCVITPTTGTLSLIRLLSSRIPMCLVAVNLTSVLSPKPARAGVCTPIPQTSSGGVLHVEYPRIEHLICSVGSLICRVEGSEWVLGGSGSSTSDLSSDALSSFTCLSYHA